LARRAGCRSPWSDFFGSFDPAEDLFDYAVVQMAQMVGL